MQMCMVVNALTCRQLKKTVLSPEAFQVKVTTLAITYSYKCPLDRYILPLASNCVTAQVAHF